MKHIFLSLLLLWISSSSFSSPTTYNCLNETQDKVTVVADLDASASLYELNSLAGKTTLIAKDELCGLKLNFAESCSHIHNKSSKDKEYSFRCDELFGDFLYTEEQVTEMEFRCFGENVPSPYQHKLYSQCKRLN